MKILKTFLQPLASAPTLTVTHQPSHGAAKAPTVSGRVPLSREAESE